jgi:hypothetical protein
MAMRASPFAVYGVEGEEGVLAQKNNDIASAPVARSCVRHLPRAMKRLV